MNNSQTTRQLRSFNIINKNNTDLPSHKVAIAGPDDSLAEILLSMQEQGVQEAYVVDDGKIIGSVRERDILPLLAQMTVDLEKNFDRLSGVLDRTRAIAISTADAAISAVNSMMGDSANRRDKPSLSDIKDALESLQQNILNTLDPSERQTDIELGMFLTQLAATVQNAARMRGLNIAVAPVASTTIRVQARLLGKTLRHVLEAAIKTLPKGNTITLTSSISHRDGITGPQTIANVKASLQHPREASQSETSGTNISGQIISGMIKDLRDAHHNLTFTTNGDPSTLFELSAGALRVDGEARADFAPAKILIVEDDSDILDMLEEILSETGFEAIRSSDGEDALTQFSRHKPRLVLADIRMPKLDGILLTKAIKSISPETPVILFSGQYPQLMEGKMDNRIKCDHVLYKPFAKHDIIESLRLFLDVSGAS